MKSELRLRVRGRSSAPPEYPDLELPIHPPYVPMESKQVPTLPEGDGFQFEPKWDGFRCLAFRDGNSVVLQSKAGQSLGAYFPEVVAALRALKATKFVLDGEMVVPAGDTFSFDALCQRVHPSQDIEELSKTMPASLILFDLLVDQRGRSLVDRTLAERRLALEEFVKTYIVPGKQLRLSQATTQRWVVAEWQAALRDHGVDGIMIKRVDQPYLPGERSVMLKMKWIRTAECVVAGYVARAQDLGRGVLSLLLGMHDRAGLLHYVGAAHVTSRAREDMEKQLGPQVQRSSFTGRAPTALELDATTRGKTTPIHAWVPLDGSIVVEVRYDHWSSGESRFRHPTKLLRFRPDKAPRQCMMEEIESAPHMLKKAATRG